MTTMTSIADLTFEPPGPGSWQRDSAHAPRPWPRFSSEIAPEPEARGFHDSFRRYGLLADRLDWRFVNSFAYYTLPPAAEAEMPERFAAAAQAFERKLWREDMERWEREAKPASIRTHLTLQAVDPATLDTDALLDHLATCREHIGRMVFQHHEFNCAWMIPQGDFLVSASEWTGLPPSELLGLMNGATPVSAGLSAELERLVAALEADPSALAALKADADPGQTLEELRSRPDEVGRTLSDYLDMVGYRLLDGYHVGEPYALEFPDILVKAIRARVEHPGDGEVAARLVEDTARVRDAVPDAHREEFDGLVAEARHTYRLRDERGVFSEVWAAGITRRSLLEAGRRLAEAGRIDDPEHLAEAGNEEMRALVASGDGPPADELAERADYRATYRAEDAPPALGPEPDPPPPLDMLPPAAARAMQAVQTVVATIIEPGDEESGPGVVRGLAASPGMYEGTARYVSGPAELDRLCQGDVLVTGCTTEAFNIALPLLGAIVTDGGGLLSHPAIVAREFGIPAVVGSCDATSVLPDGARVRVDGAAGEVSVLS